MDNAFNGSPVAQGTFVIGSTVSVEPASRLRFALSAPSPSRFYRETRFTLQISREEHVTVSLYDVQGHCAAVLHNGPLGPGIHSLGLEAGQLACGLYFIHARGRDQTAVRRVMLIR